MGRRCDISDRTPKTVVTNEEVDDDDFDLGTADALLLPFDRSFVRSLGIQFPRSRRMFSTNYNYAVTKHIIRKGGKSSHTSSPSPLVCSFCALSTSVSSQH